MRVKLAVAALGVGVLALAQPAAAQSMWTGFYLGGHAGYGFGEGDGDTNFLPDADSFGAMPFSSSIDLDGFVGGVQAGYNWRRNNLVFGVETDISWTGMDGDETVSPLSDSGGTPDPEWFQDASGEINWFGTLRARAGLLAQPNLLVFATGGLAFGEVEYSTFTSFTPAPQFQYAGSDSDTKVGWTIGAGAEWAGGPNWSVKMEYLYFDLGDTDYTASPLEPNDPFAVTQSFGTTGSIVRAGVNLGF